MLLAISLIIAFQQSPTHKNGIICIYHGIICIPVNPRNDFFSCYTLVLLGNIEDILNIRFLDSSQTGLVHMQSTCFQVKEKELIL